MWISLKKFFGLKNLKEYVKKFKIILRDHKIKGLQF